MPVKTNSEEVEDLSFVEICRRPDRGNAIYAGIERFQHDAKAQALFQFVGNDVIGYLKPGFAGIPVDASDVFEEVVAGVLNNATGFANFITGDRKS